MGTAPGTARREVGVRCMWMRGGTSKGGYFLADDLPADEAARDAFLLHVMGSPDKRQIDGMGGADPLTSKVAVVKRSARPDVDVDYLFLQVFVDRPIVTDAQNCGNILAAVGPFAIERGLVKAANGATDVRIFMENTGQIAIATVPTPGDRVSYEGTARIDGVPGTAAAIPILFKDTAGSSCGALLPTGRAVDVIDGIEATLIDNGMPCVVMRAKDLGITGDEEPPALEANDALRKKLEFDPAQGRTADESRRRRGEIGAEDDDGFAAPPWGRHLDADLYPAPLPFVDRRPGSSQRRDRLPVAAGAGRLARRDGRRPRALASDRAPDRRDDRGRTLERERRSGTRCDPAHRAQALRRDGLLSLRNASARRPVWTTRRSKSWLRRCR